MNGMKKNGAGNDTNQTRRKKIKKNKAQLAGLLLFGLVALVVTIVVTRWVFSLRDPAKLALFKDYVSSLGVGGWFLLLAIQYLQIVVAFIPGGPIQIIAGALYGPWKGLALCLLGTVLASGTVFLLVSHFGSRIVSIFVTEQQIKEYDFLTNTNKLEWAVFVLFLIPGTPKDALTYLFALTPIKMSRFMVSSILARLPAMVISLFAGQTIISGQWFKAVIMFIILGSVSLVGLLLHRSLMERVEK